MTEKMDIFCRLYQTEKHEALLDIPQANENQRLLVLNFRVETGYRSYGNFIEKKNTMKC